MRGCFWVVAFAVVGCSAPFLKREAPRDPVQVSEVTARFESEEKAEFHVRFDVENTERVAGAVNGLEWEVWVAGRWFATGRQAMAEPLPAGHRELFVELPVVFHRMTVSPGVTPLEIGVRGALDVQVEGNAVRLPFARTLTVASDGAPVFNAADED